METSEGTRGASTITAWTLIVRAQGSGPAASEALGQLLERFRPFIIWYFGRLRPPPDTNPDDLFQDFACGFIRRKEVGRLKRYGSLRGWLAASIRNFVRNEWDSWGRRQRLVHVAVERSAPITECEVAAAYLGTLVMQALGLARSRAPDPERFEKLARFLPGTQSDFVPYAEVAGWLGISEEAARAAVHAERHRYQRCLDEILLPTLNVGEAGDDPERMKQLLEQEKRELLRALDPAPELVSLAPSREPS